MQRKPTDSRIMISLSRISFLYFLYIVILYVLAIAVWPNIKTTEFLSYNYTISPNLLKVFLSVIGLVIIWYYINQKYNEADTFSNQFILVLSVLYFVPGLVLAGLSNCDWIYIIEYIFFYLSLIVSDKLIHKPRKRLKKINNSTAKIIGTGLIIISLTYPLFLMSVFHQSFSATGLLMTLNDSYGVRLAAREKNIPWSILMVEYWDAYFCAFMVTYTLKKRKILLSVAYIICELFFFTLQGNRIIIFIMGIAILLGLFKIDKKKIILVFFAVVVFQLFEEIILGSANIGFVTNIFRRYAIVPNILSNKYFLFFQSNANVPDYLRGYFPSISSLLGTKSPYGNDIGYIIGTTFFGWRMNANTGLVGGALFEFGFIGVLIDPVFLVLSLRLFDKVLLPADKNLRFVVAFIYATLAVNAWSIWTSFIRVTYLLLLIICLYFILNANENALFSEHRSTIN